MTRRQRVYYEDVPAKQPMEFSKRIFLAIFTLALITAFFGMAMSYVTQSTDVFAYLIPAVFAELAVGTAFYYHKSAKENVIKLQGAYGAGGEETAEGDDIV